MKFVLLNVAETKYQSSWATSSDWAPLWLRYYLLPETHKAIPFVGVGLVQSHRERFVNVVLPDIYGIYGSPTYASEELVSETFYGMGLEAGYSFGDVGRHCSHVAFKVLPVGKSVRDTTFLLAYDFSIGFRSK